MYQVTVQKILIQRLDSISKMKKYVSRNGVGDPGEAQVPKYLYDLH